MASIQRAILQRRLNSLDVEKDTFEKNQTSSIHKAINSNETPMKEKHARCAIIGTFTEKGAHTFWVIVNRLPLKGNPIVCWKFCHMLHKVLREGHPNVIKDSMRFRPQFPDLGKLWGLLKDGYGKLIAYYCKLLHNKLDFHYRNPRFPGNLEVTDEQLDDIGERDVNILFQLTCEMLDYLDDILALQIAVFGSLDMSRANSMTNSGQCRLAPLLPCIQDSSILYDYIVKVLFKLHAALPSDTLLGHRERFLKQFDQLKQFYINSNNLQYFKTLIQVPLLPEHPPNFLVASDFNSHISPVVVLPQHSESPESESIDMALIDTSLPQNNNLFQFDTMSEASSDTVLDDKDHLIQQLLKDIADLKMEIQRITIEDQRVIDGLNRDIRELESQVAELERTLQVLSKEKEILVAEKNEAKLIDVGTKNKAQEEKFLKLKEAYNKLREEHIVLIRNKAETEKQLAGNKHASSEMGLVKQELEMEKQKYTELETNMKLEIEKYQNKAKDNQDKHSGMGSELLFRVLTEAEQIILAALEELDHPCGTTFQSISFASEQMNLQVESLSSSLNNLKNGYKAFNKSSQEIGDLLAAVPLFSHLTANFLHHGHSMLQTSPDLDQIETYSCSFKTIGKDALNLLDKVKTKDQDTLNMLEQLLGQIQSVRSFTITPAPSEDIGELLQCELTDMVKAIEEAAKRIEEMATKSKEGDTGTKLEVDGKILDGCTTLMEAIKILVKAARDLQVEIVSQGKGSSSIVDFYSKNSRWAEGLISAAKVIGVGAKYLVDAADKVVSGEGKFEVLMVASQEIAAGTAQLVVASRVKADKESHCLKTLTSASKQVTQATANVVATAKTCSQLVEDSEMMDFSALTLHQAKKMEIESQVKVLEYENLLVKERMRLADLRRRHYHLAGPNEGWAADKEVSQP